jgi:ATP-dependent RNA helicase DDX31/DBP7
MNDGLVLNLATDDFASLTKTTQGKKGGRWTDRYVFPSLFFGKYTHASSRAKAKRVAKRKSRPGEKTTAQITHDEESDRPAKRARKEPPQHPSVPLQTATYSSRPPQSSRPPTQIISSLFSYNPKIDAPVQNTVSKSISKPSNAPLTDSSTFQGLGLDPLIVAHLSSKMNVSKPTSIQRAALPVALSTSEEMTSRDLFIQSQTGSGKTLSFLLPIIQDLLPLSTHSYIDRSIGTLAIIIAPTRELAKQISDVLEGLLKLRLRPEDESPDDPNSSTRLTRWLVSGLLTGGATRTHEKARLRKGLPFIVSTPGRLLDHLQNTASFNVGKCRWLVLDEADRLMELGFEETITGIIKALDGRRKLAIQAMQEGKGSEVGGWDWDRRRRTVLCSATIREDVQKLAGTALIQPLMIKASEIDKPLQNADDTDSMPATTSVKFTPPAQLSQKYVVVPLKLRLVALVALLRSLLSQSQGRRGTKIIVFLSCTDSVDFHWRLLGDSMMDGDEEPAASEGDSEGSDMDADEDSSIKLKRKATMKDEQVEAKSSLLPDASVFRLHGSLPTPIRLASLRGFSAVPNANSKHPVSPSSILLCTSVASRGLDLPLVRAVVQYDLPTEGGATEYVHRVGRTARAGKGGEAWSLVTPSESEWVKWVEGKMQGDVEDDVPGDEKRNIKLNGVAIESVLRNGFGGKGTEYEERATDVQLSFERWVLRRKEVTYK